MQTFAMSIRQLLLKFDYIAAKGIRVSRRSDRSYFGGNVD